MKRYVIKTVVLASLFFLIGSTKLFCQEVVGKVTAIKGKVEAQAEKDKKWRVLAVKSEVYSSDTIKTGKNAKIEILFVDETKVTLGPKATIKVEKFLCTPAKNYRESKMNLSMGKARFQVKKLFSPQSTFEVSTPTAVAGVKGTEFIMWVISSELTKAIGISGELTVSNISPEVEGEVLLGANFSANVKQNQAPSEPKPIEKDELLNLQQEMTVPAPKEATKEEEKEAEVPLPGEVGDKGLPVPINPISDVIKDDVLPPDNQPDVIDQPPEEVIKQALPKPPSPPTE